MDSSCKSGQTITVSLPADTPQNVLAYLDELKNGGGKPCLLLPLPEHLSEEQQDWFNHPYTRQLLAKWIASLLPRSPESTESVAEFQTENNSFQISTSYHSKLVGFFINDD